MVIIPYMTASQFTWAAAFLFAVIAVSGCGGGSATRARTPAAPTPSHVAQARADSLRFPYTAADVHFMSRMIGHHAQAVTIARWAPTHGASAAARTLAARIINTQQDEIATMQRWLRDRLQPVPGAHATGMAMNTHGVEHEMMPGMLTDAQLAQLNAAKETEFDRLFLSLMIQHHRGAVSMVEALLGTDGAAQDETVFKFASDVNIDQITEIARMEKMLSTLTPQTGSP